MALRSETSNPAVIHPSTAAIPDVYQQGITAGVLGAATIAVWFFLIDVLSGHPLFYTPNVLGTALFRQGAGLDQPQNLPIALDTVLVYTWVHGLVFCAIGGVAAKLLEWADHDVHVGFGVLLFFVLFEFGFVGAALIFAESILHALAWPSVLIGNLLAAAAMAAYFWRHHPYLKVSP